MRIDRDNYEEYFLLYADNELTDSEKAEVLMFLKQNKDLEEEFRMIHYTISKPDASVELADKSFLFRNNPGSFIHENNYEEIFVLYHDNELTVDQMLETEQFLNGYPQLKNEFDLIGQARLVPEDAVIFPGKKHLYRKEKLRKIVPVIFWRMLAAAVFIGFGLWITNSYFQKSTKLPGTTVRSIQPEPASSSTEKNVLPMKEPVNTVTQSSGQKSKEPEAKIKDKEKNLKSLKEKDNRNVIVLKPDSKTRKTESKNTNQLSETIKNETAVSNTRIKNIPTDELTSVATIEPLKELDQNTEQLNEEKTQPAMQALNTSYVNNAGENSQNYVFYDITTDEFKRTKVGGFLKKVKRVIERSNPITRLLSGDDRQVVSN